MGKLYEMDTDVREAKNNLALVDPRPGDAWQDHLVYSMMVVAVIPETFWTPTLVVVCDKKITIDESHWTWDIHEKVKPFSTYTLHSYARRLCYKGTEKTWADVSKGRFSEFVNEVTNEQIAKAVSRWRKEQYRGMFRELKTRFLSLFKFKF